MFSTLNKKEDEDFQKKILDLHRKLSDVDEQSLVSVSMNSDSKKAYDELERLKELELVVKCAEETFEAEASNNTPDETDDRARLIRKKRVEFQDLADSASSNTTLLSRFRNCKKNMKLLSFLSTKSNEKSSDERTARLLKIYMSDKASRPGQNTISIHHTSRDRRFWKLRTRRRSSSN